MSIIYNDTEEKSDLQRRIAAELQEKKASKPANEGVKLASFKDTDEPDYSSHFTRSNATFWVGAAIAVIIVGVVVFSVI